MTSPNDDDFEGLPPYIQNMIDLGAKNLDHQIMKAQDRQLRIFRFVDSLSADDLVTLDYLISSLNEKTVLYWSGRLDATIEGKFGLCPQCGISHEDEVRSFLKPIEPEPNGGDPPLLTEADALTIQKYRLLVDAEGKLRCRDCGLAYQSLKDRTLRPPEHCSGCEIKAKFG